MNEVFPGGSYAKGTTIGANSDVDLLVVLNGIPTTNHERWLHVLLASLRTTVEQVFQGWQMRDLCETLFLQSSRSCHLPLQASVK